jgi:predicted transcriptional regulator
LGFVLPSKRRGSLVISVAILKAAKNCRKKTHLLSSVSLSTKQFKRYIKFLEFQGFIKESEKSYRTTNKGLKLIEEFDSSNFIRDVLAT